MPKERRGKNGVAQRGKGTVKQYTVRRTGKRSKGKSKRKGH